MSNGQTWLLQRKPMRNLPSGVFSSLRYLWMSISSKSHRTMHVDPVGGAVLRVASETNKPGSKSLERECSTQACWVNIGQEAKQTPHQIRLILTNTLVFNPPLLMFHCGSYLQTLKCKFSSKEITGAIKGGPSKLRTHPNVSLSSCARDQQSQRWCPVFGHRWQCIKIIHGQQYVQSPQWSWTKLGSFV